MKMVKAVIRPEKLAPVLNALNEQGFPSVTRISVLGRGKQRGLKVGDAYYDEIPKEMIFMVVEDRDCDRITSIIAKVARTNNGGAYGDGKIFVTDVERAFTISSCEEKL